MSDFPLHLQTLAEKVLAWAEADPRVRAAVLVGSSARQTPPPDRFADLDLELYVNDPESLTADQAWLSAFGGVWVVVPFERGDHTAEYLILYEGALKLDLSFHPIPDAELEEQIHTSELDDVFRRGYRVLVDKDGITAGLPPADERHRPHPIPDPAAFMRLVNIYWYGAVYVAKQIVRGQSWLVKYRDWTNKEMLLRMLEWHALAIYGADHDVWHDGKFIWEWAEPEALGALEGCFGHFDAADSWRALLNSMTLFRRLAMDVAAEWELDYPARLDTQVTAYIMNLYGESG